MTRNLLILFFVKLLISVIFLPSLSVSVRKSIQVGQATSLQDRLLKVSSFLNTSRSSDDNVNKSMVIPEVDILNKNASVLHKITLRNEGPLSSLGVRLNESYRVENQQRNTSRQQAPQSESSKNFVFIKPPTELIRVLNLPPKDEAKNVSLKARLKLYKYQNKIYPLKLSSKMIKMNPSVVGNNSIATAASYNHEDWVNYPPDSETQTTTSATSSNSESSASEPKSSDSNANEVQQQQQPQQLEINYQLEAGQQVSSPPQETSISSNSEPDRVHVRKESSSRQVERPMVSKSITTTTTIGDGKKKAKVVTKSAALPPGLKKRIIEEFVKKGGNPQNIVVSDSTVTTTSQSKKKTITTVYKVVPVQSRAKGGAGKNLQASPKGRKFMKTIMPGKVRPMMKLSGFEGGFSGEDLGMNNLKIANLQRPNQNKFKGMMITRVETPKSMFVSSPKLKMNQELNSDDDTETEGDFDDSPQDGGLSMIPPPSGKPLSAFSQPLSLEKESQVEFERPTLEHGGGDKAKLQIVEHGDEGQNQTPNRQVKGISGGGISLNTLMDAIKHMQQMQSLPDTNQLEGKPKTLFSGIIKQPQFQHNSGKVDTETEQVKQHLANFNDFNEKPPKKLASESQTTTPSSQLVLEEPPAGGGLDPNSLRGIRTNEEQLRSNNNNAEQERRRQPSVKGTIVGEISLADTQSAEEKLEELKRAVFASTERLKERRSKVLAAATIKELDQVDKGNADGSSKSGSNEKRRFPYLEISKEQTENNSSKRLSGSSAKDDNQPNLPDKPVKTHNIMMVIDFNPPPPKASTQSQSSSTELSSGQQQQQLKSSNGHNNHLRDSHSLKGRPPRGFQQVGLQSDWFDNDNNNQWRPVVRASPAGSAQNQQVRLMHHHHVDEQQFHPLSLSEGGSFVDSHQLIGNGGLQQLGSEHQLEAPPVRMMPHSQVSDQVVGVSDYGDSSPEEVAAAAAADQHEERMQQHQQHELHGFANPSPISSIDPHPHHQHSELGQDGVVAMLFDSPAASQRYQYKAHLAQPAPHLRLNHFLPQVATSIPGALLGLFQQHFSRAPNNHHSSYGGGGTDTNPNLLDSSRIDNSSPVLPEESARTNQLVNQVIDELVMSASSGELGQLVSMANLTNQVYHHHHHHHSPPSQQTASSPVRETESAIPEDDDDEDMADEETKRHSAVAAPNNSVSFSSSPSSPTSSSSPSTSPTPVPSPSPAPSVTVVPTSTKSPPSYNLRRKKREKPEEV